ncbi:hypothetical protein CEXT_296131 [Caerostris extrusa]|uniref:Uncharacterized protein n=1 Tax=Caerostris extrusa TaxID=172846 RepID=A0AAV4X485_CAEEX|nr:hypothetical protein CEXT_296131 [Caerostris extrusa]
MLHPKCKTITLENHRGKAIIPVTARDIHVENPDVKTKTHPLHSFLDCDAILPSIEETYLDSLRKVSPRSLISS